MEELSQRSLSAAELIELNGRHVAALQDQLSADLAAFLSIVDVGDAMGAFIPYLA